MEREPGGISVKLNDGTVLDGMPEDAGTAARIVAVDCGGGSSWLYLEGYAHPPPTGPVSFIGYLDLEGYEHALPADLGSIDGISVEGHAHPLPAGLVSEGCVLGTRWYPHPLPRGVAGGLPVPVIPDMDRAVFDAVMADGIDMGHWHSPCGTTHCRAGWHVELAGDAGRALEDRVGPEVAGTLIHEGSRPGIQRPDFHCGDREAMADIRARAEGREG